MKPIITFLCAVLLTIASQASGQNMSTSFSAVPFPGQPPYPVGSQVRIDLKVSNFTNISSVLLPITYNSTVLRFDSIDNPVMPEYIDTTLLFHPNPGVIKIAWFPSLINYPDGVTIPGTNTRLLTLRFTVLANGVSNVNLSTSVPFTPIEVINAAGNVVFNNSIFNSGGSSSNGVSITGGSGTPPPPPLVGFKVYGTDVYAKSGQRVCVPVRVNDFDALILLQYAMHWDNTKLNYECVRGASTNTIVPLFNAPAAAPGTLLMQWEDPNLLSGTGVTRPDGMRVYDVCFNTIGAPGTETTITIDGFGFGFPPNFTTQEASAVNAQSVEKWENSGPNGPSGISSKVYIMSEPPGGSPVTYTADQDMVAPGGQTCVDVKVKNFTAVNETEYVITYDASKLTLATPVTIPVTSLNLAPANFTTNVSGNNGTIKFKWSNATAATVADNTTIFSLCFTATGANGSIVPINFATSACPNPTPMSAYNSTTGIPYKFENGQVTIMSTGPTLTASPMLCSSGATGSIANNPNGTATSFVWAGPGINAGNMNVEDPTGLTPGTYTVTVTYSGGNTATGSATVTAPQAISMTQTAVGVTCFGFSDGSVDITPTGGTSPYTYSWAGPSGFTATTQDITGVKTGNFVVTITDANQCTFTSPAVNVPSPQAISTPSNGIVITNLSCVGSNNGAISIAPQGGTAPYTYDWSNDGAENPDNDPQNVTGLLFGSYTVTITDSRGCSFIPSAFTVSQPLAIVVNFVKKEDAKCFGTATGKAEITVTGGTGNKTYSWRKVSDNSQVSTDQNPANLAAGSYNVIVTDANGCTGTLGSAVAIADAPSALQVSNTTTPGLCFGQLTGSIDLTVTGGWGAYAYNWSASLPALQDHAAVSSGTYLVTVTDNGGCTATQTVVVGGAQSPIAIGNPVVSNVTCFGQGNGGICLNLSGGNGGAYQVAWSNTSLTGACIGNLPGGSYAPTVTDGQSCTAVFAAISVTSPNEILLTSSITQANPTGGIDLTVTGGTPFGGGAPYTYQWTGQSGPVGTSEDITGMNAGTYTVLVTDANGCSKTAVYTIASANVFSPPNGITFSVSNSCNNDGCINLTLPASAGSASPFTISWNGGSLPPTSSMTPAVCGLAAGPYVVTVTASNGNTATVTAVVNQLQQALLSSSNTNQPFDDLHNGSITIQSAFPNCTYLWNTGLTAGTLSSLDSGLYVVTVTNNNSGCTAVYQYHLNRQYQPYGFTQGAIGRPSCAASSNGSISVTVVGGDGPNYLYHWSGPNGFTASTATISGLKAGAYSLTVTDESGITHTHGPIVLDPLSALNITNVNELSFTPGGTQVSGANICDGEASVVFTGATGNATILWSNGVTTVDNLSLCGGAYSVTVTDAQGCSSSWSGELTAPEAIEATDEAVSPKCVDVANGSAKVFVTGGIQPYKVQWSNGQFDQLVLSNTFSEAVSLAAGTYTVTITDFNLVTSTLSVIVPAPTPIDATFTGVDPTNFNSCDGERIIFVTGTAPYDYEWENKSIDNSTTYQSGTTERAEGLCAGTILYYTVTDANGCTLSVLDTVPYPADGCFLVRPVLTPAEQDGNNDYTQINCIESVSNTVEIYNRWGQLVFQTEGYSNNPSDPTHTWTGVTRTGQSLPEGVYYYVLTFIDDKGIQHQLKGHINLLK